jgi:hypothetical protein
MRMAFLPRQNSLRPLSKHSKCRFLEGVELKV